jgi:hypothetical protein
MKNKEQ